MFKSAKCAMLLSATMALLITTSCDKTPDPQNVGREQTSVDHSSTPAITASELAPVRPSDAELHAYKAYHHARYMVTTAAQAGGTNKLLHTKKLPTAWLGIHRAVAERSAGRPLSVRERRGLRWQPISCVIFACGHMAKRTSTMPENKTQVRVRLKRCFDLECKVCHYIQSRRVRLCLIRDQRPTKF